MTPGKGDFQMNQDQIERDRLLTETHFYAKSISEWAKEHDKKDNERFDKVNKEIESGKKLVWGGIGGLAVIEFIFRIFK